MAKDLYDFTDNIKIQRDAVDKGQKGFLCGRCAGEVPKSEYEVFFETGLCGYCEHMVEKWRKD